jgi:hypothetical protein
MILMELRRTGSTPLGRPDDEDAVALGQDSPFPFDAGDNLAVHGRGHALPLRQALVRKELPERRRAAQGVRPVIQEDPLWRHGVHFVAAT